MCWNVLSKWLYFGTNSFFKKWQNCSGHTDIFPVVEDYQSDMEQY